MSKKDYKQGMADAMSAYEGFGQKQEAAIRHVEGEVGKVSGKVDQLGGKIGEVADYITDQEKAALYKLNTPVDIADLADADKRILLAVLYQLSADEPEITEEQQNYVRAVQQYLKIYNPQTEIDLDAVENVEDIPSQKAILQAVLEFFRLGTHPGTYTEDQMEFLDCFQVNRKTRKEINGFIDAIVNTVGIKGLSEKYGLVAIQPKSEFAAYEDNGPVPEKVADICVSLIAHGGLQNFGHRAFLETKDYYLFCKDADFDDGSAECNCQLFRLNKKTGCIDIVPINYEKDFPVTRETYPSLSPSCWAYHIQGNTVYLIENHLSSDEHKQAQMVAINLSDLSYNVPFKFPISEKTNSPYFHISGNERYLVVYAFSLNEKLQFSQIQVLDLEQKRTFLIAPDMIVRDAFWWNGGIHLLGQKENTKSIFRYDIGTKTISDAFSQYPEAFDADFKFGIRIGLGDWVKNYKFWYLLEEIEQTDSSFRFLIRHVEGGKIDEFYCRQIEEDRSNDFNDSALLDLLKMEAEELGINPKKYIAEQKARKTYRLADAKAPISPALSDVKCGYQFGDYVYKKESDMWYRANVSKGAESPQWELIQLPN